MDKKFICLVSCQPYDDLNGVIAGIEELKSRENGSLSISPYLALMDLDQISMEKRGSLPEITFGTAVRFGGYVSPFAKAVEGKILKDKKSQFVLVGEQAADIPAPALGEEVRSSLMAGLPVILRLYDQGSVAKIKEKLEEYFSDLSQEQLKEVTLVYQANTGTQVCTSPSEIQQALHRCRQALEQLGGVELAEQMKILFSIPKFSPELLHLCLSDGIDGVCISPGTLPEKSKFVEEEPLPQPVVEEEEIEPDEAFIEQEIVEPKPADVPVEMFTKGPSAEECLIFCHAYDAIDETVAELKNLAEEAGHLEQTEWLLALPFTMTAEARASARTALGAWNLSFANAKLFTLDTHLSLLKERGVSFVVLGERLGRNRLGISDRQNNLWLRKVLEHGLSAVVGTSFQMDLPTQLETLLEGVAPEDLSKVRLLFFAGNVGSGMELEGKKIDERVQALRTALNSLYGEEIAGNIKVLVEISHFSEDPFSFLSHRAVNGISLSASAIKGELLSKRQVKIKSPVEETPSGVVVEECPVVEKIETEPMVVDEETEAVDEEAETVEAELEEIEPQELAEALPNVPPVLKLTIEECAERLAEKSFQETYIPGEGGLESPEVKLARLKAEYKRMFEDLRVRCFEGWQILFKELEEGQREKISSTLTEAPDKIAQFVNEYGIKEKDTPWYEMMGLSKEQLDALYIAARRVYEKKEYKESAEAFFTLISLHPKEYRLWFGYGMAKKLEKEELETALDAFSVASSLIPQHPEPYIHAAECYLTQENLPEAERCLSQGKELISDEQFHLSEWANYLTEQLSRRHP